LINICFHGIGRPRRELEPDEDHYWISEDLFGQVLEAVAGRSDVAISFDDGNVSDLEVGLEGLARHHRTATFFVLAGRLDREGSLATRDLRELHRRGMTIGSHGMDHVPWRHLPEDRIRRELVEARELISQAVGVPVGQAALPLGRYDRTVLSHLKRLGYDQVFSSDRRRARPQAWLQPRYSVRSDDTIESIRSTVLAPPSPVRRVKAAAVGAIKRFR
jgi:peptidoglycan/xylan/chitin deacetylase (PgdA/CDA1 family)